MLPSQMAMGGSMQLMSMQQSYMQSAAAAPTGMQQSYMQTASAPAMPAKLSTDGAPPAYTY